MKGKEILMRLLLFISGLLRDKTLANGKKESNFGAHFLVRHGRSRHHPTFGARKFE